MRNLQGFLSKLCILTTFAFAAHAQTPAVQEDTKPADVAAFFERTMKFTGSVRARWEGTDGKDFSLTPADSYLITRARLGVAFQPVTWLRFSAEAQDAHAMFYKTSPGASVSNPFDLRQAYVETGAVEGNGLKVRVGRDDVQLGSFRLIGVGDWGLTKTFDTAHATYTSTGFKLDVLGGSVVLADPTRMDRHKPGEHFYVAYSAFTKLIPGASVEPYFMAKTALNVKSKGGQLGDADTLYMGGRVIGKLPGGFDYSVEGVREGGGYSNDTIRAWGYVAGGGWAISKRGWQPHISSDLVYASGDSGIKDGRHQSFDFMYGLQQPLNSMTGQFSWRNIKDWRAGADFKPVKKLMLKVDYRNYWLATTMDGLYNSSGTRTVFNTKATSAHVGEGVDAQAILSINKKTLLGFGIGNIAPGSYLKQSGKTSGFVYPCLYLTRYL